MGITAVYASDAALYPYLPMAINSLLVNNPDAKVYVFADDDEVPGIKHPQVKIINSKVFEGYITPDSPQYSGYYLPKVTFHRLWMADVLEEDRVLWLDVDTIVDGDLTPIWETSMGLYLVAGVADRAGHIWRRDITDDTYINAGVLLFNLSKWRVENMTARCKEAVNIYQWMYGDQDIINYLCQHRICQLPAEYNVSKVTIPTDKEPVIRHYADHPKLWEEHDHYWTKYHVTSL